MTAALSASRAFYALPACTFTKGSSQISVQEAACCSYQQYSVNKRSAGLQSRKVKGFKVTAVLVEPPNVDTKLKGSDREGSLLTAAQVALEQATLKKLEMGHGDTALQSTTTHRAWIAAGCGAILGMLAKSALAVHDGESLLVAFSSGLAAYILADLGTGIYHWGVDNYGDASTPVFGPQIDAFQGHHKRPWTITKRQFANNLHALARPATFFLLPFLALPNSSGWDAFLGIFLGCVVFSQQFHAWAHQPKTQLPAAVVALQDAGLLVGRKMHGAHHRPPFNGNYCIVSGICNQPLDQSQFLPWLESTILKVWGVAPRCWGETAPEWLADGAYFEDGSEVEE